MGYDRRDRLDTVSVCINDVHVLTEICFTFAKYMVYIYYTSSYVMSIQGDA